VHVIPKRKCTVRIQQFYLIYCDLMSCTTPACFSTFYYCMVPTLVENSLVYLYNLIVLRFHCTVLLYRTVLYCTGMHACLVQICLKYKQEIECMYCIVPLGMRTSYSTIEQLYLNVTTKYIQDLSYSFLMVMFIGILICL